VQLSKGGIRALEDRFREQEEKVKQVQKRVDDLRLQLGVHNVLASGEIAQVNGVNGPVPMMTADTLRKLESLRIEQKMEYVRQAALLDTLKTLGKDTSPEVLSQALTTAAPDALLSALLERLAAAEQRLASLTKEYGAQHPDVVAIKSQVADLRAKTKERVDGVMLGLNAKVLSLSNSVVDLDQEVAKATQRDIQSANESKPYYEAKRSLEELQRFRQVLDMKIATEKIDLELPKTAMVEIVDRAFPAQRPVSPNQPRAVALIALGLLLDVVALLMLKGRPGAARDPRPA
jgi:polysaccharide biosynthesis transport protein